MMSLKWIKTNFYIFQHQRKMPNKLLSLEIQSFNLMSWMALKFPKMTKIWIFSYTIFDILESCMKTLYTYVILFMLEVLFKCIMFLKYFVQQLVKNLLRSMIPLLLMKITMKLIPNHGEVTTLSSWAPCVDKGCYPYITCHR